jgi:hypothetical protein
MRNPLRFQSEKMGDSRNQLPAPGTFLARLNASCCFGSKDDGEKLFNDSGITVFL